MGAAPPTPGVPPAANPPQGAPPQGATWPTTSAPGYAVPPPSSPPVSGAVVAVPPAGSPPLPPVRQPPLSPRVAAPAISVTGTPGIATRNPEPLSADDQDSTRNRQLGLLAAIAAVAVLGTTLTVAVIAFRAGSQPTDDGGAAAMESMSGPLVEQQADASLHFSATDAVIHGDTARRGSAVGREVITNWTSASDWLSWDFRVEQPRMFRVELVYAAPAGYGGKFSVAIDDMKREAAVRETTGADVFSPHEVGFLTVRRSGRYRLDMRVVQKPAGQLMILRTIRLTPYDIGHVR